jgi:hypothetical protein
MRKTKAIAIYMNTLFKDMLLLEQKHTVKICGVIVGVLSLFGMSHFAYASTVLYSQVGGSGTTVTTTFSGWGNDGKWYGVLYFGYAGDQLTLDPQIRTDNMTSNPTYTGYWHTWVCASVFSVSVDCDGDSYLASSTAHFTGGLLDGQVQDYFDTSTHFISVTPASYATVATGTVTLAFTGYIASGDYVNGDYFDMRVIRNEPGGLFLPSVNFRFFPVSDGAFSFSTTTVILALGMQNIYIGYQRPYWRDPVFHYPFGFHEVIGTTTDFIVGTSSYPNSFSKKIRDWAQSGIASTTDLSYACNLFTFDVQFCISYLIYPDPGPVLSEIRNLPPWGYGFRFYDIIAGDVASTAPPFLYVVVPPGIPGTGAVLNVTLDHSIDYVLNATSSTFVSGNATDTRSLYDITSYYWNLIVYSLFGLYIVGRIIPLFRHKI